MKKMQPGGMPMGWKELSCFCSLIESFFLSGLLGDCGEHMELFHLRGKET